VPDTGPVMLQYAVLGYLALLPVGHLVVIPVRGVWMTGADGLLGVLLLAGAISLFGSRRSIPGGDTPVDPGGLASVLPAVLLLLFAAWVAASGLWGFHRGYALLKGLGFAGLSLGVFAIGGCGLNWRRAVDAWLVGLILALAVTWIPSALGPEVLRDRVVYLGGMVDGLPLPRLRGPFLHPNMFGDYLVVSLALLWTRWSAWSRRNRPGTMAFGAAVVLTLVMTVSSAWVQAGVVMTLMGLAHCRRRAGRPISLRRPIPAFLLVSGIALTVVTAASLIDPLHFSFGPWSVQTGGIRPSIWASAFEAVKTAPLRGVGAAPFLAQAADPRFLGSAPTLWDAHSIYLSLLAQFGVVGLLLAAAPVFLIVRNLLAEGVSTVRIALLVALLSVGVHGIFQASEELRHVWALLGIAVLVTHWGAVRTVFLPVGNDLPSTVGVVATSRSDSREA
jgi:O-Antigen ligase